MEKKISLNDPSYKIVNYPRPSLVYLLVSYLVVWPLFRLFFRGRVYGISNVPSETFFEISSDFLAAITAAFAAEIF